jgi:large subunit ribosomal protein L9
MKVIVKKTTAGIGEAGQVIQVKDGYARNFLIPQGIAQPATGENLRHLSRMKSTRDKQKDHLLKRAEGLRERVSGVLLTITKKVGEHERLFGTVTTSEIAEALAGKGIQVERRIIQIPEPIKSLGTYPVHLKIHGQVQATVNVEVVPQQ